MAYIFTECEPSGLPNINADYYNPKPVDFRTSQIHMDHAEVGPWIPCLRIGDSAMKKIAPTACGLLGAPTVLTERIAADHVLSTKYTQPTSYSAVTIPSTINLVLRREILRK